VCAHGLEQCRTQRQVAILASLAVDHADDHALAVDISPLQARRLRTSHPGAIEQHQQRAVEQGSTRVDQTRYFFLAEDAGKLLRHAWIRNVLAELIALQRTHVEKTQCGYVVLDRARRQLARLQQVRLVGAQVIRAQLLRRLAEEPGVLLNPADVVADRALVVVAALELFEHHLA